MKNPPTDAVLEALEASIVDRDVICTHCNGSGAGSERNGVCPTCKGAGWVRIYVSVKPLIQGEANVRTTIAAGE